MSVDKKNNVYIIEGKTQAGCQLVFKNFLRLFEKKALQLYVNSV